MFWNSGNPTRKLVLRCARKVAFLFNFNVAGSLWIFGVTVAAMRSLAVKRYDKWKMRKVVSMEAGNQPAVCRVQ